MNQQNSRNKAASPVQNAYTEKDVLAILLERKRAGDTLRDIAADYSEITHGDIGRMLKGIFPKSPRKRKSLGLGVLVPTPACSKCGEVHVSKHCTATRKRPTRWADMPVRDVLMALKNRQPV